ncbi:hypothetical protein LXL04_017727 [Taraxacum kok-saghyz]
MEKLHNVVNIERTMEKRVPISPSNTSRSIDKTAREIRAGEVQSNGKHDREKGVNVQVIVRCRPLSNDETKAHTPVVITCTENKKEVSVFQNIASKQIDRSFVFDKVFGPNTQQRDLYHAAVSPIVFEVLEGYNCTIFAYGQTGTGKTYTMEGGGRKKNGEFPSDAGVIPRAVGQIFDTLEALNAEYDIKVTFLELYNEEIIDLLVVEETSKSPYKPIALMEDGKGGVFIRGLEEEIVSTADEIYKILEKGSAKRRTAETLLNKQSSRSHSIFSITIHIKETTPEGEKLIRCGKLDLIDLAGSESISRSGSREGRAREAGEINKSLLTLGRVINTLVEHSVHIPYRDSKLTRFMRDSLGGKTKTCIIATISPSIHSLEETLSTLDYAHRAKHIKNKPQINQKMMKSAMMKDMCSKIERLKQEVYATTEENGICVRKDRYLHEEEEEKKVKRLPNQRSLKPPHWEKTPDLPVTNRVMKEFEYLRLPLGFIKDATNNFGEGNLIGEGGFGKVFRGEFLDSEGETTVAAVKRLDRLKDRADVSFWSEVMLLSTYIHENIISLLGICDEFEERILVYEYLSNKSLDLYLDDPNLTWILRLKICLGAACGLEYLHNAKGTQQRVLHRDIKSANILLDENWNTKIADFGLSRYGPANQQHTFLFSDAKGTLGYCDPEYIDTMILTKESDVYSFGVVLFEVLCSRLCVDYTYHDVRRSLPKLVIKCYKEQTLDTIIDVNLRRQIKQDSYDTFVSTAYQCLERDHMKRPSMDSVVTNLQTALRYQEESDQLTISVN